MRARAYIRVTQLIAHCVACTGARAAGAGAGDVGLRVYLSLFGKPGTRPYLLQST